MAYQRICSIDGCGKPHDSKGLCKAHYWRLRKHGDPLGGGTKKGDIPRFISEIVLPHDSDECLFWPFGKSTQGYGQISINGKKNLANRYVCELAHGSPPSPRHEAAHSCGNGRKGCVNPKHLSWKTSKENKADKLLHGTHNRGERHNMAKLTEEQVRSILSIRGEKTQKEIAEMYGVSEMTISRIYSGEAWECVPRGLA